MSLVPKHIKNLKPYVSGKSQNEFKREFGNMSSIKLASNENPLGSSPKSIKKVQEAISYVNRYPDSSGYELRMALSKKYKLSINNVILGAGSEGIMSNIMRTFLSDKDEIVSSKNSFIGFRVLADASGFKANWAPMKDFHYDLKAIAGMIDSNTKIVYLANPDNPTGTYFKKNEFDDFMKEVPSRVLIILDEAYYEYALGVSDYPDSMLYRYDNVITLRTFSKIYGLAGFRVGYGFAHEELISNLMKVKLPFEPNILAQEAALGALDDDNFLLQSIDLVKTQKEILINFFIKNGIQYIDSQTNFITIVFDNEKLSQSFSSHLLSNGVIVRNLIAFDLGNCCRITIGTKEENLIFMKECVDAMEKIEKVI